MKESDVQMILPLGTVVTMKEGSKRVMLIGRFQQDVTTDKVYDYTAVLYPEGILGMDDLFLFDKEDIGHVYFMGYQCHEETLFKQYILEQLKKLNMLEQDEEQVSVKQGMDI